MFFLNFPRVLLPSTTMLTRKYKMLCANLHTSRSHLLRTPWHSARRTRRRRRRNRPKHLNKNTFFFICTIPLRSVYYCAEEEEEEETNYKNWKIDKNFGGMDRVQCSNFDVIILYWYLLKIQMMTTMNRHKSFHGNCTFDRLNWFLVRVPLSFNCLRQSTLNSNKHSLNRMHFIVRSIRSPIDQISTTTRTREERETERENPFFILLN